MPIPLIAGAIAAVGTVGGALISSSSQKKAANTAAQAQQQATDSQLQLGRESMALNQGIYNSNYGLNLPFVSRGNAAGEAINALLGLPSAPAGAATPQPAASAAAPPLGYQTNPVAAREPINAMAYSGDRFDGGEAPGMIGFGGGDAGALGRLFALRRMSDQGEQINVPQPPPAAQPLAAAPAATTAPAPAAGGLTPAQQAFENFAHSAGMDFQLKQGADTVNNLYAARGVLQSGAAMKALQDTGQKTALDNYFLPYMGLLGGQQSTGAQSGAAIAGVGGNFGRTAADIYGGMGSAVQGGANAAANAAAIRGLAGANVGSSVANGLGQVASSFLIPRAPAPSILPPDLYAPAPVSLPTPQPLTYMPGGFY